VEWPDGLDTGVVIGAFALFFTVASFWWLNARRGSLRVARPGAYVFADRVRLRLPLAFYNTGAVALIVADLRIVVETDDVREPLHWIAVLPSMGRSGDERSDFATPFDVPGRGTRQLVAEFGDDKSWSPEPSSRHMLRLEAKVHPSDDWRDLAAFDWWAPPPTADVTRMITYRNSPDQEASV